MVLGRIAMTKLGQNIDNDVELIADVAGMPNLLVSIKNYLTDMANQEGREAENVKDIRRAASHIGKAITALGTDD